MRFNKLSFALLTFPLIAMTAVSRPPEPKHPRTFQRPNQECPPEGRTSAYHWDDGKGNDLTVEIYCVKGSFFSTKVIQSKDKKETVVVSPFPAPDQELKPVDAGNC